MNVDLKTRQLRVMKALLFLGLLPVPIAFIIKDYFAIAYILAIIIWLIALAYGWVFVYRE